MAYGSLYYGKGGFQYKKNTGSGNHRIFALNLIANQTKDIHNKFIPGSGVGASSISNRRAKLIHATTCYASGHRCGFFK